ncbi:TrmH family RNA methyltransferase [Paeniglutamicibacter cryotolerans]|uniref:TrmH family RNA methyltransferase n=1 Tax=Paeniglutamicibacter cryotolerans TaxID=670079 RepID=A0A839QQD7_9MICC|nr:RNA methyltransferase [Paeniglutamicibacter cryotolerans]MBB2996206.1 TrmH family RNA methyltransferase [Paeniglutamicibacter cryotolerans]
MISAGFSSETMSNPRAERVREVAHLATRGGRAKLDQFLAEGPQAVREALKLHAARAAADQDPVVAAVYATEHALERYPEFIDLVAAIPHLFARIVTDEVLAAMADTVTPQGIVAVCYLPQTTLAEVLELEPKLVAVLCRIQDPGNAGTILRAADAAGADALILTSGSVDIYNPKAVRSTVGSLFHLPIVTGVDFEEAVESLRAAGHSVLAADGYGDRNLDDFQDASTRRRLGESTDPDSGAAIRLEDPTAWLFGNEGAGLTPEELSAADERVAVPLYGVAESLNVGTAATVCMYASARAQRGNRDK